MSGPPCVDPYRILGIAPSATDIEAKAAYRRLALLFHPDRNNSEMATEMMRIINLAHDAIRSPAARAEARRRAKPEPAKQEPASRRYVGDPCNFVMAFGKYRGRTLRDIEKIAPQYLDWLSDKIFDEGPDAREAALVELIRVMREHFDKDNATQPV